MADGLMGLSTYHKSVPLYEQRARPRGRGMEELLESKEWDKLFDFVDENISCAIRNDGRVPGGS